MSQPPEEAGGLSQKAAEGQPQLTSKKSEEMDT